MATQSMEHSHQSSSHAHVSPRPAAPGQMDSASSTQSSTQSTFAAGRARVYGDNANTLSSHNILQLQGSIGNRAVVQLLADKRQPQPPKPKPSVSVSPVTGPSVIQRNRSTNPYAQVGSHGGWDLTAHHIVPHSKLVGALEKLSTVQQQTILRYSVPDVLTDTMLTNLKVKYPDSVTSEEEKVSFRATLRAKLVSEAGDDETVSEIRLGDIRQSLFEWQGGNQFQGPNTSIRAEPSQSKDDIDYDGEYFTSMLKDQYKNLITRGEELVKLTESDKVFDKLKEILDLTKNVTPKDFDPTKWQEIGSLETLELLSNKKTKDFNREHLKKYAFFKVKLSEVGGENKYKKITYSSGDYHYSGVGKIPFHVKGTDGFVPINIKDEYTPITKGEPEKLSKILEEAGVTVTPSEKKYTLTLNEKITTNKNSKKKGFKVAGYDDEIPYMSESEGTIDVAKAVIDGRKLTTSKKGESLYNYLVSLGTPTSSFLPKALYEKITAS